MAGLSAAFAGAAARAVPPNADDDVAARDAAASKTAVIVLIGDASESPELLIVLSELLARQGVHPHFVSEERFQQDVLLAENENDPRVWVFVAPGGQKSARLYFRGPFGKRFLLRELALRSGLDEVGRELIAQVVESSTATLLHTATAGISREEAAADLARVRGAGAGASGSQPKPSSPTKAVPPRRTSGKRVTYELGVRLVSAFTGGDLGAAFGAGAETGVTFRTPSGLGSEHQRGFQIAPRLLFEVWAPQTLDTARLHARIGTNMLRGGVDAGFWNGPHSFVFGLGVGADLIRITPTAVKDSSLALAPESTGTAPVVRTELRYELSLSVVKMTGSLFADTSLVDTHYDVLPGGGANERLATPWRVRPGVALTIGVQ